MMEFNIYVLIQLPSPRQGCFSGEDLLKHFVRDGTALLNSC